MVTSRVNSWSRALNEGHEICVVFFDVRNVFDRVPHQLLLQQMQHIMNLDPYLLRWLYPIDQFVAVEGEKSNILHNYSEYLLLNVAA